MVVARLGLEALILGVASAWVLLLVPAGIVTLLKNRVSLFLVGLVTLGLTWIVAAVSLAPPDSWWARTFYGKKRLARAVDPIRHPRSRRTVVLSVASTLGLVFALGLVAARPSPILGVDGLSLGHSVGTGDLATTQSCLRADGDIWTCERYDDQLSGVVEYIVRVDGSGCWTALRADPAGEESPGRVSGCITIVDHILG